MKLDTFDKVLIVVIVALLVGLIYAIIAYMNSKKTEKKLRSGIKKYKEDLENSSSEYDVLMIEYKSLMDKFDSLKKKKEKLYKMAFNDRLTDLPNKDALYNVIDSAFATLRKDEKFILMHIDLDNFKIVNDTLGHSYGDELILDVSHRIKEAIDDNDTLARYGSDEFLIFSQNIDDVGEYEDKVKKIQKVFSYPFVLANKEFFITMSIGLVVAPDVAKNTQSLIMNADLAMYEAKAQGKNTYCYYNEEIGNKYAKKLEIQSEVTKALENDEFEVHYQPVINLDTNDTMEYEAFVRWNHPEKGLLYPDDFIDVAIDTGQIINIGKIVLEDACKQLKKWSEEKITAPLISINFSKRQFYDNDLIDTIKALLEKYEIPGTMLEIEVKESTISDDIERAKIVTDNLCDLGVRIIIDNFGSNCSTINMLKVLPISKIKIDKAYLESAMFEECDRVTIASLISIADSHGITCIVEGVEYGDQIEFLKTINCQNVQGYLFGKPELKNI